MSDKLKKTLIGALIAVALAAAVSYGLISQQTADSIQGQANQALQGDQSTPQQGAPPQPAPPTTAPQTPGTQAPAPAAPSSTQAPRQ